MSEQTWLFISYKTGEASGLTFQARAIKKELVTHRDANYHVFLDKDDLRAGEDWNQRIYTEIPRSHILLLLLAPETAESDWVRREVDVAKGAQVTILPVLIRDFPDLQSTLDRFDIPRLQAVRLFEGSEEEYAKLFEAIEALRGKTEERQRQLLEALGRGPQTHPFDPPELDYKAYSIEGGPKVCIAAGNIMAMKPIDVFVNSENDYMQMARVFDDRSISSMLRFRGSRFDGARRLVEDTVQNQLNGQVKQFTTRPVGLGTVIVTQSGHEESELVKSNRARFIFHTAVVSVQDEPNGAGKVLGAINEQGLMDAVRTTLDTVAEVNQGMKPTPPPDSAPEKLAKPIESIIFPLFGTGSGGLTVEKVAILMARAIKEFVLDNPKTTLKRIYVCAYTHEDVSAVEEAFQPVFAPDEDEDGATEEAAE